MGFSRKPLQILHSSFIIHHSLFSLSPLLLNSFVLHFFKRLNSYKKCIFSIKRGNLPSFPRRREPAYAKGRRGLDSRLRGNDTFRCFRRVRHLRHVMLRLLTTQAVRNARKVAEAGSLRCSAWKPLPLWAATLREDHTPFEVSASY